MRLWWDWIQDKSQGSASVTGVGSPYSSRESEVRFEMVSQGRMRLKQNNHAFPSLLTALFLVSLRAPSSPSHEKHMGVFLLFDSGVWDLSRLPITFVLLSFFPNNNICFSCSCLSSSNLFTFSPLLGPDLCCGKIACGINHGRSPVKE